MSKASEIKALSMADYTYLLPEEFIAYSPLAKRDESKLLVWDQGTVIDDHFYHLDRHLPAHALVVFNKTKVIAARLFFETPEKKKIELFLLEPIDGNYAALYQQNKTVWKCMVGGLKKWKNEAKLELAYRFNNQTGKLEAQKLNSNEQFVTIEFNWNTQDSFIEIINAAGAVPLPPYIKRESRAEDKERYQTIYAKSEGSVAAPTAGLHFTDEVFKSFKKKGINTCYVTLHVGAGTFKPVQAHVIGNHDMHEEYFEVEKETIEKLIDSQNQIVAVGTTSMRTLESLYWVAIFLMDHPNTTMNEIKISQWEHLNYKEDQLPKADIAFKDLLKWMEKNQTRALTGRTSICITPGYRFKVVDMLITNFHQPQSTLLLLIAAIMGEDWKKVYTHALEHSYRFLSYGDSSILKISKEKK
ncbi:MAG: hypothetical protein RL131_720 [Bacteroidota bacterium]